MRRRKKKNTKLATKITDIILWFAMLGFGAYLGIKLLLGFIFYDDDLIFYYGFGLCGYVAILVLGIICWLFIDMIIKEFKTGDDDE